MATYHIIETVWYRVEARSAKQAEKKLLDHVKAFKDDSIAELDGVEFLEVEDREVVKLNRKD